MNIEQTIENSAEKEYDFENGVKETINRIEQLLSEKNEVVISISGPCANDTNVGKTTLSGRIGQELRLQNIPYQSAADSTLLDKDMVKNIKFLQKQSESNKIVRIAPELKLRLKNIPSKSNKNKMVIILSAEGSMGPIKDITYIEKFKKLQDEILREAAKSAGLPLSKIDIRILIYRPDRTPSEQERQNYPDPDIVIKNDKAQG